MGDETEYDAWETVPNSNGMLKRFELPNKGYIYAVYEWAPPEFAPDMGLVKNECWRVVNAFFVPKG